MFEAFLANTSTQGLSPLGTAPQRSFELISGTVREKLGDRHAALFAEPVATQYGDRFDWYAATAGKPLQLDDLDGEDRVTIQAELQDLLGDISEFGQLLLTNNDPDQQRLGEALCNAVRFPGKDCVFVLEDGEVRQPVLLNWAWVSDTQAAVTGDLSGRDWAVHQQKRAAIRATSDAPVTRTEPQTTYSTVAERTPLTTTYVMVVERTPLSPWWLMWIGWLLLLLMIGAILYLTVEACALRLPGLSSYCPPAELEASAEERYTLFLRNQIAGIERQIGSAARACRPEGSISPIPVPRDRSDLKQDTGGTRLAESGGREAQLNIALLWDLIADSHQDLKCPRDRIINFGNRSACVGRLDIGGNHDIATTVPNAIESVYFDAPPEGVYSVSVPLYNARGQSTQQEFRSHIKDGAEVKMFEGQVVEGQVDWTQQYEVRRDG